MKKYLFLTALVGASLASCTQEEIDLPKTGGDSELITFASPVVGNMTRADVTNPYEIWNNYPTAQEYDFAVWAYYYADEFDGYDNGATYMNEVKVGYNSTSKTWAPYGAQYYWPKYGTLTFIGYSPASKEANAEVGKSGIKFSNYTVSTTQAEQVDLMFSERSYNQKNYWKDGNNSNTTDTETGSEVTGSSSATANDVYTGAHLLFKHALSSILFNIRTDKDYTTNDYTEIKLKSLTLNNVITKATFDQGLIETDANGGTIENPVTSSEERKNNGVGDNWTPLTYDDGSTTAKPYTASYPIYTNDEGHLLKTTKYWPSINAENDTVFTYSQNGLRTTDLILIPQALKDITLTIEYTIKSKDSDPIYQVSTINLNETNNADWDWGYRYIYSIVLGLETITIEPYVTPWVDETSSDINVNDNNTQY